MTTNNRPANTTGHVEFQSSLLRLAAMAHTDEPIQRAHLAKAKEMKQWTPLPDHGDAEKAKDWT